jgi:hypothetical protein
VAADELCQGVAESESGLIMKLKNIFRNSLHARGIRFGYTIPGVIFLVVLCVLYFKWSENETVPVPATPEERNAVQPTSIDSPARSVELPAQVMPPERIVTTEPARLEEMKPSVITKAPDTTGTDNTGTHTWLSELSEEKRHEVIEELSGMDPYVIIDVVMDALSTPDPEVRKDMLDALSGIDLDAVNTPLLTALADENPDVVEKAMDILDDIHTATVLPSLERAINDSNEDIRDQALSILEDIPDRRAVDILINQGLRSDSWSTREDVLDSLGFIIPGHDFESPKEAATWWAENRETFVFDQYPVKFFNQQ